MKEKRKIMKQIIIFFLTLLLIIRVKCLKYNDLCYLIENKPFNCYRPYSFSCERSGLANGLLCAKTEHNCNLIELFATLKGDYKKKNDLFMRKIKYCHELTKFSLPIISKTTSATTNITITTTELAIIESIQNKLVFSNSRDRFNKNLNLIIIIIFNLIVQSFTLES